MNEHTNKIQVIMNLIDKSNKKIYEHDEAFVNQEAKIKLNADKIEMIFRDVTAMYRDLGNLENSKMDK